MHRPGRAPTGVRLLLWKSVRRGYGRPRELLQGCVRVSPARRRRNSAPSCGSILSSSTSFRHPCVALQASRDQEMASRAGAVPAGGPFQVFDRIDVIEDQQPSRVRLQPAADAAATALSSFSFFSGRSRVRQDGEAGKQRTSAPRCSTALPDIRRDGGAHIRSPSAFCPSRRFRRSPRRWFESTSGGSYRGGSRVR